MQILVFQGGAPYNAMNRFSEQLGAGLRKLGHQTDIVNLLESAKKNNAPLRAALKNKPQLAIGFNNLGATLRTSDKRSVYDLAGCRYLGLLLDHPAFHLHPLEAIPSQAIFGVVDPSHLDYLRELDARRAAFFAPHGGIQSDDHTNNDRPIDVLFLGTGMDAAKEKATWQLLPMFHKLILEEAFERFWAKPQAWDVLLREAAHRRGVHLPARLMTGMIVQLEVVMRAEYRLHILRELDKAGVKVTIMGSGWEHARFKHHELHPSVEFYDALKLLCKAKLALNASPQFFLGTHERVFASMLNGAVAVTSESAYYRQHFKEGEHYLSFNLESFSETVERTKELLKTPTRREAVRHEALKIAQKDHRWENRARELLDKFETLHLAESLYRP